MEKILTVSVAAYGVEKYIRNTLDSLVGEGTESFRDRLEILVNDDGGKDGTLDIAKEYAAKLPGIVLPVHKENGGYGSVINHNIGLATGKYFKQLDGDDWFDTSSMGKFVDLLENIDSDSVSTITREVYEDENRIKDVDRFSKFEEGEYVFADLPADIYSSMHGTTYKTSVLRHDDVKISEGRFYTDIEYLCNPLKYVKTLYVAHFPIYCYRLGREGQSVSKEGYLKHYKDLAHLQTKLIEIHKDLPTEEVTKRAFVETRIKKTFNLAVKCHLLPPASAESKADVKRIFEELRGYDGEMYEKIISGRKYLRLLPKCNFALYRPIRVIMNRKW